MVSDWIKWEGGECPVHWNTWIQARFRDGCVTGANQAKNFRWNHIHTSADIVEYRLAEPRKTLEEAYEDSDRPISDGYVDSAIRTFSTGATRNLDMGKLDYEGFLSPLVIERFAEYMNKNRLQADGKVRESDNWQKGMPKDSYMKSGWRHFFDWWKEHRGFGVDTDESLEEAICALIFNAQGYLHEHLKNKEGQ